MTLLHAIETCLRRTKVPPSRFGREAVRDPRLVHDLRRGRQPGSALDRRVRAYIASLVDRQTPRTGMVEPGGMRVGMEEGQG